MLVSLMNTISVDISNDTSSLCANNNSKPSGPEDCIVNFTNFTTLRLVYNPKTWYTILILILQRMKPKHREVR